ncbi:MAG: hypothetical protein MMC33_009233 [Icmadophila ericetorum]|nr:hypothetical protein [Icmadophila ericetorum]
MEHHCVVTPQPGVSALLTGAKYLLDPAYNWEIVEEEGRNYLIGLASVNSPIERTTSRAASHDSDLFYPEREVNTNESRENSSPRASLGGDWRRSTSVGAVSQYMGADSSNMGEEDGEWGEINTGREAFTTLEYGVVGDGARSNEESISSKRTNNANGKARVVGTGVGDSTVDHSESVENRIKVATPVSVSQGGHKRKERAAIFPSPSSKRGRSAVDQMRSGLEESGPKFEEEHGEDSQAHSRAMQSSAIINYRASLSVFLANGNEGEEVPVSVKICGDSNNAGHIVCVDNNGTEVLKEQIRSDPDSYADGSIKNINSHPKTAHDRSTQKRWRLMFRGVAQRNKVSKELVRHAERQARATDVFYTEESAYFT